MTRPFFAALLLPCLSAFAQPLVFNAASVRPNQSVAGGGSYLFAPGGGYNVKNGTLLGIIESAYDVPDFQIVGAPGWANSDRYDVTAVTARDDIRTRSADPGELVKETRMRVQALLADRFGLKAHKETRDMPVYALALAKSGFKLNGAAAVAGNGGIRGECGQMTGIRASIATLTYKLSRQLSRPVVDQTGLSGNYDFKLEWTPDSGPCADLTSDAPSIFTALQEQLGLKLEPAKGPVEVVLVEHAEKADAN